LVCLMLENLIKNLFLMFKPMRNHVLVLVWGNFIYTISPEIEGMLISTSLDGYVKVWDIKDEIKPIF